jgi:serine protease
MPIRAIRSVIRISQVKVAEAINFAVDNGAQVITMSLGGLPSVSLGRALRRAVEADVIVLAAAGNCCGFVVWPARYDICIAVAGTNVSDLPWKGSCRGADVDISAPGENVFRAKVHPGQSAKGTEIGQGQRTSFSVALTAGVAALWLAHHGRANLIGAARARGETLQAMFVRLLRATARRPVTWDRANMGAGIVDARALLEADFDLGRDRESTAPIVLADSEALSVRRLVAEALTPAAAAAPIDWKRYGPEVAATILNLRLRGPATEDGKVRPEAAAGAALAISPPLREAARQTELGKALGVGRP